MPVGIFHPHQHRVRPVPCTLGIASVRSVTERGDHDGTVAEDELNAMCPDADAFCEAEGVAEPSTRFDHVRVRECGDDGRSRYGAIRDHGQPAYRAEPPGSQFSLLAALSTGDKARSRARLGSRRRDIATTGG